jgi:hypothetical protein
MFGRHRGDADQQVLAPCPRRHRATIDRQPIERRVFGVETQAIERGHCQHLDDDRRRRLHEGADDEFAVREAMFEAHAARRHNRSLARAAPSASAASLA